MAARLSALFLSLLVLLGAWHEGVHLLEHSLHEVACPHEGEGHHHGHSHAHHAHHDGHGAGHDHDHAPVGTDGGPLFADPAHAGHAHVCFVCSTPPSLPVLVLPQGIDHPRGKAQFARAYADVEGSWVRDALPPRRGPPTAC
ncbi:MAG: hypothetical protein CMJ94_01275 [Planctomycetes bacterium]|nr:hypothetical protein [Planctomycetota bacterium]